MSESSSSAILLEQCIGEEEKHGQGGERFISTTTIHSLTALDAIGAVLNDKSEYLDPKYCYRRIVDKKRPARLVFLILIRIGKLRILQNLLSNGFSDLDLPIKAYYENEKRIIQTATNTNPFGHKITDYLDADLFREKQWLFLSPTFGKQFIINIKQDVPLPLIEKTCCNSTESSTVYRVKLHPDHITTTKTGYLAMKRLKFETDNETAYFKKEMGNLERFQKLDHPHLVKALYACPRRNEAFFFFPWADRGDLYNFWTKTSSSGWNAVSWMLGEMVGLCCALKYLAAKVWRHSDLKPANILSFSEHSVLKITDVGISKFHILNTTRRMDPTTARSTTRRYSPPEFEALLNNNRGSEIIKLSRKFDIWSLGCVFIEFLIWAKLGQHEYQSFDKDMGPSGQFWNPRRNGLDARAERRITRLKESIRVIPGEINPGNDAMRKVLGVVQSHMLLRDSNARDKASDIHRRLEEIRDLHSEYCSLSDEHDLPLDLTAGQDLPQDSPGVLDPGDAADLGDLELSPRAVELNTTSIPPSNTAAQNYVSEILRSFSHGR